MQKEVYVGTEELVGAVITEDLYQEFRLEKNGVKYKLEIEQEWDYCYCYPDYCSCTPSVYMRASRIVEG